MNIHCIRLPSYLYYWTYIVHLAMYLCVCTVHVQAYRAICIISEWLTSKSFALLTKVYMIKASYLSLDFFSLHNVYLHQSGSTVQFIIPPTVNTLIRDCMITSRAHAPIINNKVNFGQLHSYCQVYPCIPDTCTMASSCYTNSIIIIWISHCSHNLWCIVPLNTGLLTCSF